MSDEAKTPKEMLQNLLSEATDLTENRFTYGNNVQLYFGGNEVTLDIYYVGPVSKPNAVALKAQLLHRIVLPVAVAKEMAELLLNGISHWEADFGVIPSFESDSGLDQEEPASKVDDNE